MDARVQCDGITMTYGRGALAETVLRDVTLRLHAGEACVVLGPSGSGKTSLLSILGCLLSPTSGELWIEGRPVGSRAGVPLAELRRREIGFIFQHAQLLPFLTMEENLRVVGRNAGLGGPALRDRIEALMHNLGIQDLRDKKPAQASGGQRQRVAIARALLHRPPILLADEPTAALDWHNGEHAIRLLVEQAKRENALLVAVTHDTRLVPWFDRVFMIDSGSVVEQAEARLDGGRPA
jgi:putative ABC transport system ATP-binding protein